MWTSIKSILRDNKTKCIIIENEKPAYVIVPFEEYQLLIGKENNSMVKEDNWNEERVNGEIQGLNVGDSDELSVPKETSTVRIEDLPF